MARIGLGVLSILIFLLLWEGLVRWQHYPPFILPSPRDVWMRFVASVHDGSLWRHTSITLVEILGGLLLGVSLATLLGYFLAKSSLLDQLVSPYLVALQALPVVAIAPLLVIWIHHTILRTVIIAALVLFFPVLVNIIVGLRSVEPELVAVMRSLRATRWQIFTRLEIPFALPILLAGLKVGSTLAVIGAVVGEFVGADRGLGFLIHLAQGLLDTPLMFVAIFVLVIIALSLYGLVSLLEHTLLAWKRAA